MYLKGKTWWVDLTGPAGRVVMSLRTRDRRQAEQRAAHVELQVRAGVRQNAIVVEPHESLSEQRSEKPRLTLGELYDRVVDDEWRRKSSYETFFKPMGGKIVEAQGRNADVFKLTMTDLLAARARILDSGVSGSTWNRCLNILGSMLAKVPWYCDGEEVPLRVSGARLKEPRGRVRVFTHDECRINREALEKSGREGAAEMARLVDFLEDTGARLGEALRVRGRDVNLKSGLIQLIDTKTGDVRSVPLSRRQRQWVEDTKLGARDRLFPTLDKERCMGHWKYVKREVGAKGDREYVLHTYRHTFATRVLESTGDLRLVQDLLGHKNIETTTVYAKVAFRQRQAVSMVVDSWQDRSEELEDSGAE